MKVVVNGTPLIALSLIDRLQLLPRLFDEILIPPTVYREVAIQGGDRPGREAILTRTGAIVQAPAGTSSIEPLLLGLDAGEFEVILLSRELQGDWVLIDERLGRRVALSLGLPVKGSLGLLLAAVGADLMTRQEARESVSELLKNGICLSSQLIRMFESELERL
ncbi:DUF3368 domain-containing protein [Limnospira sp. PMC 1042.18]|uniref:DUF3368 domain-containing protein n=1 Tax=Limnospira sp. PMC 1042.18 TaxID=2981018 RepID=UPI0028E15136|nr:DUF3368 domain-containing protein [Limnospira sp. PMC 1042.18]MDT9198021.1 DUF3368 domain-containing protein [Limnospira sp. PMC 1042.18]